MRGIEGLYLELLPDGGIKRNLATDTGEVELDGSTVTTEVIEFSELSFEHYATILELIAHWSEQVEADKAEDFGKADIEAFLEMVQVAYDLAEGLSEDNPLFGTLTKTLLDDTIGQDDGSAAYIFTTKAMIENQLAAIMLLQFRVNDALHDLCQARALDFETAYPDLKTVEAVQVLAAGEELIAQYRFRSVVEYYKFLFLHFVIEKPNVAWCECCGRYFIPKTKKKTLYCDRVIEDGKTCKDLAPALKHRKSAMNDRVLEEFDRAKRRLYKRAERAYGLGKKPSVLDITLREYYAWLDKASFAKNEYLEGKLSETAALEIILDDGVDKGADSGTEGP